LVFIEKMGDLEKLCLGVLNVSSGTALFFLLWLSSADADRNGYITNFCSMIELFHEPKTAVVNIEAFRNLIMSQQGKRKTKNLLDVYT